MPSYQKTAVASYFAKHKPTYSPDIWNATEQSRAYPDVSANGCVIFSYPVFVNVLTNVFICDQS